MESLSLSQARKLVLLSQRLPPKKPRGSAKAATLQAIEHLGYIQIDTISVVQRAHHHTLWSRNASYSPTHLDALLEDKSIFEYWSHAAAYLPMKDYRFSLRRKNAIKAGHQSHWFQRDEKLMKAVLKRIEAEGPLMAKDFEGAARNSKDWGSKPTKQALENLFMQGDLMISRRQNFHKVYDLTERVLPAKINTKPPTETEYARFLINRYLSSNGLGSSAEMSYLLKNTKALVESTLKDMVDNGEVLPVNIKGSIYYHLANALSLLDKPLSKAKAKILSPFDNLLIQRKRMVKLFSYDYLLECYLPATQRQFGYFCLPILWNGQLVARMDCKADRKAARLDILNLAIEPSVKKIDEFANALSTELNKFNRFNGCTSIQLHHTIPNHAKACLDSYLHESY